MDTQSSSLHEERLDRVAGLIRTSGARSILDLGCGSGSLLRRLMREARYEQVVGVEQSGLSLRQAREMLAEVASGDTRVSLLQGSYMDASLPLSGFDAAAMVETIEHVDPGRLSEVQRAVFGTYRPGWVVMTTPNAEYNPLFDLRPGEFRDPDHKFEWPRHKFRHWCATVAKQSGYQVRFSGIGEEDPELGPPTQVAVFNRF
ncbi:3' terminal RNA ribose 2'-O-methyltransferase Hen1 [Marinobacter daqiaonensis]|uniref:Small RNA 2'-O-methyltransferase n=1 Tax=Marinobacter daqiaonensis TaxID=650891 RepID=A0A1I6I1T4_9GAMM|nr:methyltransferase domain-containing protein [Marinobacter daqiaonensis]SFR60671.1 3' terminal RNA ribose 2'-O-methyltransferase Hen1 [Marinobacter daqiaonensis]